MSLQDKVNSQLLKMREVGGTGKGVYGEQAVLRVCEEIYQKQGGMLFHSFVYKTNPNLEGNVKKDSDGRLYLEAVGKTTEIDILLVTPYKIFPIEVKAYKAKTITLTDKSIAGCFKTDKSPVHQNEMHCRHLYDGIFRALPYGYTEYIEPIVVFPERCEIKDERSLWQKAYIKVASLNQTRRCIEKLNKPREYRLDLDVVDRCLKEICISCERKFALRKV